MRKFGASVVMLFVMAQAASADPDLLSHDQIKSGVDAHIADLKGCMKSAGGQAKGKLVIRFGVLPNGHTVDAKVQEPSSGNPALDKCVVASSRSWVFASRGASAPVQGVDYPFVFSVAPPPKPAEPQGSLKREDIVKTIGVVMPKVGDCLDDARLKKADVTGVVTTEIHVGVDGKITEIKQLSSTTNMPSLDQCIVGVAKTLVFPKPDGNAGVIIEYPFVLKEKPAPKK